MTRSFFSPGRLARWAAACTLAAAAAAAAAAPLAPPPSARLTYQLKATAKGFRINVESQLDWSRDGGSYRLVNHGSFLVFSFEFASNGSVDDAGVHPARYQETRNRKVKAVDFDAQAGQVRYTGGSQEPYAAGMQDRMSVLMQLAAMGRADPGAFAAGKVASFRVAGSSHSDTWRFKAVGNEQLDTTLGKIDAVHLVRERDHDDGQKIEVWLSSAYDWLPVRVLSQETSGDSLDQVLTRIER
ncbi:hypothetical protein GCM10023144_05900 [Pigmentiphaga soli]|uniref:DUF3108 domain-containing protein n=2 Tax=Pigmentiphaga soli TaxID=1007095 RepID=A0ABP8GHN1_9BURK